MTLLNIPMTETSPLVRLIPELDLFEIRGKSIMQDSFEFYKPVIYAIQEYLYTNNHDQKLKCEIQLEYFNTTSAKSILDLFKVLEKVNQNTELEINWYYDGEDLREAGEDYLAIINLDINLVEYDATQKLNLLFDLTTFTKDEIAEVIATLSEIYKSIGGDRLVIKRTELLEQINILEPART